MVSLGVDPGLGLFARSAALQRSAQANESLEVRTATLRASLGATAALLLARTGALSSQVDQDDIRVFPQSVEHDLPAIFGHIEGLRRTGVLEAS
jgi:hypothetical protein